MTALMSVVIQVLSKPFVTIGSGDVFLEIDLLVFDSSPESFDHHVVDRAAFAIHADGDIVGLECSSKFAASELRTLIGVEDFRL